MAFRMEFTDFTGTTHANSYWYPTVININYKEQTCRVIYEGFKDVEASANNKNSLLGAVFDYNFGGTKFVEIMGRLAIAEDNPLLALMLLIDELALETQNIQIGEGEEAEFISFFENAKHIIPNLLS